MRVVCAAAQVAGSSGEQSETASAMAASVEQLTVSINQVAEIIREAALDGVRDELPHSIAVTIDDISERETGSMTDIYASVVVERDSQKAIIIGHKGSRLASVGARARAQIEPLVGTKVFLKLHVRVAKEWQRDPKQLGRLGF